MSVNVKVAIHKQKHPEAYCPAKNCLWFTGKLNHETQTYEQGPNGGRCPRHPISAVPATPQSAERGADNSRPSTSSSAIDTHEAKLGSLNVKLAELRSNPKAPFGALDFVLVCIEDTKQTLAALRIPGARIPVTHCPKHGTYVGNCQKCGAAA